MATKIRLKRIGRRNRPFYRIVVMDQRSRRDGAAIEELGWYNPLEKDNKKLYMLKEDRILHWLKEGAQTTDTAHNLLRRTGLAFRWHLIRQGLDEKAIEKEMKKWNLEKEDSANRKKSKAAKIDDTKKVEAIETVEETVEETAPETDEVTDEETPDEAVSEPKKAAVEEAPDKAAAADINEDAAVEKVRTEEEPVADTGESGENKSEEIAEEVVVEEKVEENQDGELTEETKEPTIEEDNRKEGTETESEEVSAAEEKDDTEANTKEATAEETSPENEESTEEETKSVNDKNESSDDEPREEKSE